MFTSVLNLVAGTMGIAASVGLLKWLLWYAYNDDNSQEFNNGGDDNNEND